MPWCQFHNIKITVLIAIYDDGATKLFHFIFDCIGIFLCYLEPVAKFDQFLPKVLYR